MGLRYEITGHNSIVLEFGAHICYWMGMYFFPMMPKTRAARKSAKLLYAHIVGRGREPVFYEDYAVPDTLDGRFEMIALHTGLLINRVKIEGTEGQNLAQAIFDEMFLKMEMSCRQLGIGDLGVPRHIKRMMQALQGRALTYAQAIEEGALPAALAKNLYATVSRPSERVLRMMSDYILACKKTIEQTNFDKLKQGEIVFADLPGKNSNDENSQAA